MAVHFYILAREGISMEKAYATSLILVLSILLIMSLLIMLCTRPYQSIHEEP
jgi:phosphate transport system permease protein